MIQEQEGGMGEGVDTVGVGMGWGGDMGDKQ